PLPRSRRATREHSAGNENTSFGLDLGILDEGDADGDTYHVATEVWERRANTGQDDFFLGNGQRDQALSTKELGERRTRSILDDCVRRPNEKPKDMFFRFWGDHAFELTQLDALSTFGVDVDTASYTLARRYLNEGNLPSKAAIRTEEFVNYFKPDLLAPSEETFAVTTELAPSRFGNPGTAPSQRWLLRVGVRGKEIAREERKPMNLTFVVDTSGSMKEGGRLELVKHSLRLLVSQLNGGDSIAIVGFSKTATLVLPMTSAQNRDVIEGALYGMAPDGGTNAESGLVFGYEVAAAALSSEVHNRVVLLSDGVANIGQTDQDRINDSVRKRRESGIYLNTIGVGMSNHNDAFLEQLANKGDGLCNYVDSPAEARRALVENFTGAFQPIARDVKIQAEFDPSQVYCYRLLGYENRAIADADFRNDAVDAGEVGAGHQVVALYELELTGAKSEQPLAQIRLRWKAPSGAGRNALEDSATERSFPVLLSTATNWAGSTPGYRRSTLVAQFAEILRRSRHAKGDSLDELIAESELLNPIMNDPDFTEFLGLLKTSRELILRHLPVENDLSNCIDSLRRNRILRAQLEELRRTENKTVLNELEQQNAQLEAKIRDLIQSEVENRVR
ncbi:MAG: Ca-activated chloride channel family protein, partial [Candidatus Paceibacteria bacterium]